jgi:hypothetical protein
MTYQSRYWRFLTAASTTCLVRSELGRGKFEPVDTGRQSGSNEVPSSALVSLVGPNGLSTNEREVVG